MPQQLRSEETRERILHVSQACFAELGYEGTSTTEICQQAGVSKGAFYYHFPSKQAVFLTILDRWLAGLDARMEAAGAQGGDMPSSLRAMVSALAPVFRGEEDPAPIFLEIWSKAAREDVFREAATGPFYRYRDYFTQIIQEGLETGSLRPVDPELLSQLLVSLSVGLLLQSILDPEAADWSAVARQSIDLVLNALSRTVE